MHVDAFSTRPDAKRVIERRYGPGVKATIFTPQPPAEVCAAASSYVPSPDGLRLDRRQGSGEFTGTVARIVLSETADHGQRRAWCCSWTSGTRASSRGPPFSAEVQLASPLGARQVLDGETGEPLRLRESSGSAE